MISGTPASPPGTASFTVKVTDSNSSTATQPLSVTTLTVYAPQGPVRARLPQLQPRAGRVYSNPGAPLRNPGAGPVFRAQGLIRIRVQPPLRGRIYATIKPAPVIIPPVTGPRVYPLEGPVQAKLLLPRRGICRAAGFFPGQLNPQSGPAFRQADTPARIRIALAPRGRIASGKGGPVENPVPPVTAPFRQTAAAVRIRPSLPLRGRVYSGKGAPVRNPGTGPVFRLPDGAQARIPLPRRGMCRTIKFYPLPSVPPPHPGPVVYPLTAPVRAPFRPPPRGRIGSNSGMVVAVIPPPHPGPVFYPRNFAKPQQPLPRRGTCRTIKFYSLIGTIEGVFVQAPKPARIRPSLPPRGRIASNPGAPVHNPHLGPVFRPAIEAIRARQPFPRRGQCRFIRFTPLFQPPLPPVPPPFYPLTSPVSIRFTLPPRGRTASSIRTPVRNSETGPVFRQATQPARIRITLPPRGWIGSNKGGPLENPIPPIVAVFFPKTFPVRARIPANAPRGRVYFNSGVKARSPQSGPVFRQAVRPVQARFPLPPEAGSSLILAVPFRTRNSRSCLPAARASAGTHPAGIQ